MIEHVICGLFMLMHYVLYRSSLVSEFLNHILFAY